MNGGAQGLISGQDILILGGGDWDLCPREPDLVEVLVQAGNRVLCLESPGMRRPELHLHDLRRILFRLGRARRGMRSAGLATWVIAPLTLPFPDSPLARRINTWIQKRAVGRAMKQLGMTRPIVWVAGPIFEPLLDTLQASIVVYDCFDEWTAFPGVDGQLFGRLETQAIRRSHLVLAASTPLLEAKRPLCADIRLLRNGVHEERFRGPLPPEPADLAAIPHPRLGYAGNIYGRLDLEALGRVADARPDWSIVLLGLVRSPVDELARRPNVHVLGHRPKDRVPTYLRHLDLGLVTHRRDPLTDRQDPTKIYEYLAAGLPVVASDLEGLDAFAPWVRIVSVADDLVPAIADELASDDDPRRGARRAEAARHGWTARAVELSSFLREALARAADPTR